jgi:hypothetical protein
MQLYEFFAEGGQWFFTMELIEPSVKLLEHVWAEIPPDSSGTSAGHASTAENLLPRSPTGWDGGGGAGIIKQPRLLQCGGMNLGRLRETFRKLAEGVVALHGHNKLHRDLKPANVLIRRDGRLRLVDFGSVADLKQPAGNDMMPDNPVKRQLVCKPSTRSSKAVAQVYTGADIGRADESSNGTPWSAKRTLNSDR